MAVVAAIIHFLFFTIIFQQTNLQQSSIKQTNKQINTFVIIIIIIIIGIMKIDILISLYFPIKKKKII